MLKLKAISGQFRNYLYTHCCIWQILARAKSAFSTKLLHSNPSQKKLNIYFSASKVLLCVTRLRFLSLKSCSNILEPQSFITTYNIFWQHKNDTKDFLDPISHLPIVLIIFLEASGIPFPVACSISAKTILSQSSSARLRRDHIAANFICTERTLNLIFERSGIPDSFPAFLNAFVVNDSCWRWKPIVQLLIVTDKKSTHNIAQQRSHSLALAEAFSVAAAEASTIVPRSFTLAAATATQDIR